MIELGVITKVSIIIVMLFIFAILMCGFMYYTATQLELEQLRKESEHQKNLDKKHPHKKHSKKHIAYKSKKILTEPYDVKKWLKLNGLRFNSRNK